VRSVGSVLRGWLRLLRWRRRLVLGLYQRHNWSPGRGRSITL